MRRNSTWLQKAKELILSLQQLTWMRTCIYVPGRRKGTWSVWMVKDLVMKGDREACEQHWWCWGWSRSASIVCTEPFAISSLLSAPVSRRCHWLEWRCTQLAQIQLRNGWQSHTCWENVRVKKVTLLGLTVLRLGWLQSHLYFHVIPCACEVPQFCRMLPWVIRRALAGIYCVCRTLPRVNQLHSYVNLFLGNFRYSLS